MYSNLKPDHQRGSGGVLATASQEMSRLQWALDTLKFLCYQEVKNILRTYIFNLLDSAYPGQGYRINLTVLPL